MPSPSAPFLDAEPRYNLPPPLTGPEIKAIRTPDSVNENLLAGLFAPPSWPFPKQNDSWGKTEEASSWFPPSRKLRERLLGAYLALSGSASPQSVGLSQL